MYKIAILAYDGCYASSLAGFADILQVANSHIRQQQGDAVALFEWHFLSMSGLEIAASNGLYLKTEKVKEETVFDLVLIPSAHYAGYKKFNQYLEKQFEMYGWIKGQWRRGAWLAANCTGTFILAETGLLNGRAATTTWWLEKQFRNKFPLVDLQMQPIITEADKIICAGAFASYLALAIRVTEIFYGKTIAAQTAKSMLIDVSQTTQTPYLPLIENKTHTDTIVHRAQHWLQKNMGQELKISNLAEAIGASERTLIRRFKSVLGKPPLSYLQDLRIDAARSMLETSDFSIEKIALQVGYNDTSSFSRLFRERIGLSPGAYRRRFQSSRCEHF